MFDKTTAMVSFNKRLGISLGDLPANENERVDQKVARLGFIYLDLIRLQERCLQLGAHEPAELIKIVQVSLTKAIIKRCH